MRKAAAILLTGLLVVAGSSTSATASGHTASQTLAATEQTSTSGMTSSGKFLFGEKNAIRFLPATMLWTIKDKSGASLTTGNYKVRATYYPDTSANSTASRVELSDSLVYSISFLGKGFSYQAPLASFEKTIEFVLLDDQGLPFGDTLTASVGDFPPDVIDLTHKVSGTTSTLTATLKAAGVYGTGNIEFFADQVSIGVAPTVGNDIFSNTEQSVATLVTDQLLAGTHSITAKFLGNGHLTASPLSDPQSVTVQPEFSATIEAQDITCGEDAVITLRVVDQFGTKATSGTAIVTVDGQNYTVTISDGLATLNLSNLAAGTYTVDANYIPASPAGQTLVPAPSIAFKVKRFSSSLTVPNSVTFADSNDKQTITVQVGSGSSTQQSAHSNLAPTITGPTVTPTGTVLLEVDGNPMTSSLSNGEATFEVEAPAKATGTLEFSYSGDDMFESSTATSSYTVTPTPEPSPEPTPEPEPSASPSVTPSPEPSSEPANTPTAEPSAPPTETTDNGNGEEPTDIESTPTDTTPSADSANDKLADTGATLGGPALVALTITLVGAAALRTRRIVGNK